MKRFHVHVSVDDLAASVRFYSTLFATAPTVLQSDYAKWMLEDPRVNFAISSRGGEIGVNHLGIQVDSKNELAGLQAQLAAADPEIIEEAGASCCYARSDKYWVTDPAGVAWETFHTLGRIPVYGNDDARAAKREACCEPPKSSASVDAATVNAVTAEPCCTPTATTNDRGCCAG